MLITEKLDKSLLGINRALLINTTIIAATQQLTTKIIINQNITLINTNIKILNTHIIKSITKITIKHIHPLTTITPLHNHPSNRTKTITPLIIQIPTTNQ